MRVADGIGHEVRRSVLVVDESNLFRELLVSRLSHSSFSAYGAGSPTEAWEVFKAVDPDALIVDVNLTAKTNGITLAEEMLAHSPGIGLIFLTNVGHPRIVSPETSDIPAGAGYMHKAAVRCTDEVLHAVDAVLREDTARIPRHDIDYANLWGQLSTTQIDVLRLVADGLSNQEIAAARGTQIRAVEALISRTFDQLDAHGPARQGNRRVLAARHYLLAAQPVAV